MNQVLFKTTFKSRVNYFQETRKAELEVVTDVAKALEGGLE